MQKDCEKTALVYFTEISRTVGHIGGSEMLLFLIVHELQRRGYAVTVALQSGGDVIAGSRDYGVKIEAAALKVVNLSASGRWLRLLDRHLKFLWQWRLKRLGRKHGVCISCANVVDFGRPGVHFIYMLTLDEAFKEYFWQENTSFVRRLRLWCVCARDAVVKAMFGIRSAARIVRDGRETVLPNSDYAKRCIEEYYGCKVHASFYPPTVFEFNCGEREERVEQAGYDIAYIGRFEPEKRIQALVEIVKAARVRTRANLRLRLAGKCPDTENGREIAALARQYEWLQLEGTLYGDKKAAFLGSCKFAIHGCKVEAFGISVTEYLKGGLVPIVPKAGGSSEVVGLDDLTYASDEDAVKILCRLVQDRGFYERCAKHCRERAQLFGAEAYLNRQHRLLEELGINGRGERVERAEVER